MLDISKPSEGPNDPTARGGVAGVLREPNDGLRAVKLDRDLRAREQQIALAAEAANMGFWFRDFEREDFWASNRWRALFGFTSSETLYVDEFLQRLHPNDRESTLQALENAYQGDGSYQTEHRVLLPDGQVRWIACHGRVELNGMINRFVYKAFRWTSRSANWRSWKPRLTATRPPIC